jgi:glycerophosphoryl diester phosphodiesterase
MGLILAMVFQLAVAASDGALTNQWPKERANQWYAEQAWRVGCNFIPSTASNQLEMWQAETWDPQTIDQELLWASKLGMNSVRVSLHDLAWEADAEGFKNRIDQFLTIAAKYKIKPMLVIFDDCRSVENSGWLQSPGNAVVNDPAQWGRLERYVKDILSTFGNDQRILFWDLYNEPGNSGQATKSLPLLKATFKWARSVNPTQPLSVGIWNEGLKELNDFQLAASDIITFHRYGMAADLSSEIGRFKKHGRPLLCTIWLRHDHSDAATVLPVFKQENVACYNWGFVSGKVQTIWPWGTKEGALEPDCWFHGLLRNDGTPHDPQEVEGFRNVTEISVREESTARPLTVAHRGVSKYAPENTLPAFELAWEQGADAIEGDFRLTKDGHIVCIHDHTTRRTTEMNLVVADSTLDELRALDAGGWFAEEFTGAYIPTLTEVLATVPAGKKIYIEVKCGAEIIPALLEDVKQSGLSLDQIVVISFKPNMLKELKVAAADWKISWLVSFRKSRLGKIAPTYSAVLETLASIQANGLSTSRNFVDAFFISLLTEKGIGHHVWTIDDGKTAKRFQKLGTKSITTNVPEDIQSAYHPSPVGPTPDLTTEE